MFRTPICILLISLVSIHIVLRICEFVNNLDFKF